MIPNVYATLPNVVLIADPQVLAIPIHENHEPLFDLRLQKDLVFGPSPEIPNNKNYTFLRKTVYEKLKEAQTHLPKGLQFCIYEGYRSLSLQKMLFEKQYERVKRNHPDWSATQIFLETTKLVSPIINLDKSINIPPHSTGGAVDVYLIDEMGLVVDMGMHPKDGLEDNSGLIALTDSKAISAVARHYRQIMSQALRTVGFVNYPTEYWHWSYGDRYWAYMTHKPAALYGTV